MGEYCLFTFIHTCPQHVYPIEPAVVSFHLNRQRIVFLLGSISFGLIVTSFVTLYYAYLKKDVNSVLLCFKILQTSSSNTSSDTCKFSITYGMVTLWTLGGVLHSAFDISLWFISACCCLLPGGMCQRFGRFRKIGSYFVLVLVACMVAMATFAVILRAKYEAKKKLLTQGLNPAGTFVLNDPDSFSFVLAYLIEQALVWFVYYFILVSVLFSGILGCGCIPILGGRPYEMMIEWKEKERTLAKQESQTHTLKTSPVTEQSINDPDSFEVSLDVEKNKYTIENDKTINPPFGFS